MAAIAVQDADPARLVAERNEVFPEEADSLGQIGQFFNFRTYCAPTDKGAVERAEPYARHYINMFLEPLERWRGQPSAQYPGYEKFIDAVEKFPYDVLVEQSFIGSPEKARERRMKL